MKKKTNKKWRLDSGWPAGSLRQRVVGHTEHRQPRMLNKLRRARTPDGGAHLTSRTEATWAYLSLCQPLLLRTCPHRDSQRGLWWKWGELDPAPALKLPPNEWTNRITARGLFCSWNWVSTLERPSQRRSRDEENPCRQGTYKACTPKSQVASQGPKH